MTLGGIGVKQDAVSPDRASIARDFPELNIVEHPDGTWEARGPMEPERRARLDDMFRERRELEIEKQHLIESRTEHAYLKSPDGRATSAPAHLAEDKAKRAGMLPVIRHGKPTTRTVYRQDGTRIEVITSLGRRVHG